MLYAYLQLLLVAVRRWEQYTDDWFEFMELRQISVQLWEALELTE